MAWAYVVELTVAAVVYGATVWFCGFTPMAEFAKETGAAWANMTGVLFAASLTIWVAFVNITTTRFGGYLRYKGVYGTYSTAFVSAMLSFFATTGMLIAATATAAHVAVRNVALGLLIYSAINVVTLVRNATGLVRAHAVFREESNKLLQGSAELEIDGKAKKGTTKDE